LLHGLLHGRLLHGRLRLLHGRLRLLHGRLRLLHGRLRLLHGRRHRPRLLWRRLARLRLLILHELLHFARRRSVSKNGALLVRRLLSGLICGSAIGAMAHLVGNLFQAALAGRHIRSPQMRVWC
jgi:hypothetical protein